MASAYWILPLFKGLIDYDDPNALTVVGRYLPMADDKGHIASPEEYLNAVRRCAKECPELAQTLSRAISAAVLALEMQARGHRVTLVSVEGCTHRLGSYETVGHEIVATIWNRIVRPGYGLPPQRTGGSSYCTVLETADLLREVQKGSQLDQKFVQCVTHDYHVARTDQDLREAIAAARLEGIVTVLPTLTPEQVIESTKLVPDLGFLRDVIAAAALPAAMHRWEERGEILVRMLHRISRWVRFLTFGAFDLELALASSRLRQRS